MGQGQINSYQAPRAGIQGILEALNAVHAVYGIKQAKDISDALSQQSNKESDQSKFAQAETNAYLDQAAKKGYLDKQTVSNLHGMVANLSASDLAKNTEMSPISKYVSGAQSAEAMGNKFSSFNDTKKEIQENNIHQQVLGRIQKDPTLTKQLVQYQNLDNALSLITKSDHITPQQFDEFQQSIRGNLGIKGSSGVDERSHTYLNSIGLNADRWAQVLQGKPASMSPDDPFLVHVKQLANLEQKNVEAQTKRRLGTLTSGNEWLYQKRPDLKMGLENAISAVGSQYQSNSEPTGQSPSPLGTGIGPSAEASEGLGPHGNVVRQNGVMYLWNHKAGKYEPQGQ